MKRTSWWNPRLPPLAICVLLVVIHFILKEVLSRYDVVSCIFVAGDHVPWWMLSVTLVFIVVRLAVILLVPSVLAWYLVLAVSMRAFGWEKNAKELCDRPHYDVPMDSN